jgi:hypothetical protein
MNYGRSCHIAACIYLLPTFSVDDILSIHHLEHFYNFDSLHTTGENGASPISMAEYAQPRATLASFQVQ